MRQKARPIGDWDEKENGNVLWWNNPITRPPYVGTPYDDAWPDGHIWWTPLVEPELPPPPSRLDPDEEIPWQEEQP